MWFLLLLHVALIQPLMSQDADKRLVLSKGRNPCEGQVEVLYKDKWGLVGDKFWNRTAEEVVCRSTYCGEPVKGPTQYIRRSSNSTVWLNELQCDGGQRQLWDCDSPGWNISFYHKPVVRKITCSLNITFSLEGSRCAGAVRFSTDGVTPTGYICNDNWGDKAAGHLCKQLGCGVMKKRPTAGQMPGEAFQRSKKMKMSCAADRMDNLWQCAAPASSCQHPAAVICSEHERLRLSGRCSGLLQKETDGKWENVSDNSVSPDVRCQQMYCGSAHGNVTDSKLTCTDNVTVVLVNNNQERCYGRVHILRNESLRAVCGSSWTENDAKVVCEELGCGTVNSFSRTGSDSSVPGIMDFVECSGSEDSLWHCEAKHGENLRCSLAPSVICSESLKVRLADGGGECAGRLEVENEGQWKRVLQNQAWTDEHADVVCRQLQCGNKAVRGSSVKYSQGSGNFLTVNCKSDVDGKQKITECTIEGSGSTGQAVGITCEGHKVLFLSESCSGEVGIEQGGKTFWLSGAGWNQDVANTVCQQMHCGNAVSADSKPIVGKKEVWSETYNCSGNEASLFDCGNATSPSNASQIASIASVNCSGKIELKLTRGCWGNVDITMDGESGGICVDTWTEDHSKKLCKELKKCGGEVLIPLSRQTQPKIMVKSLLTMQPKVKLTQYNFIMNQDDDRTCQRPAYVVCSGSVTPRFTVSRDSCFGKLELQYEDNWLPVCMEALNDKAQNAICRRLNCGQAVEASSDFGPTPSAGRVITQIQCSTDNPTSLKDCNVIAELRACTLGVLKCAEWKTMVLEHDEPCKGEVVVYSSDKERAVSSVGWTKKESQRLCKDMTCGSPIIPFTDNETWPTDSFFTRSFNCTGTPQSIWKCEKNAQPMKNEKLFIECQNKAKVTLSQKCYGELMIDNTQVCNSQWKMDYSNMVCQELDCSNALDFKDGKFRSQGPYHHIHCDEYNHKLGQCRRVQGSCRSPVELVCVGSIKFNTTGTCGGNILVGYGGKWKEVFIQKPLAPKMMNQLCQKMGCGLHNDKARRLNIRPKKLEMSLECSDDHLDIRHCVKKQSLEFAPAQIYCTDFIPQPQDPPENTSTVPIILGVSFLLILLIVVAVGARFYFTRRNKKLNAARMLPGKEVEFESGEYEDVVNGDEEMEDARGGRFRSDAEFFREDDRRSASSLPYDDIDEAAEAQPLNPPANTTRAGNMQEDKVTYEVEDPLENYDDIESGLEVTKAEIHDGPQPTADADVAAPPAPPGDGDYLVPGQDG